MSVLTTTALKAAPSAAADATVTIGGTAWTYGSWVQVIASTGATAAIAGLSVGAPASGSYNDVDFEVDVGVGASGSEVSIGTIRWYGANSAGTGTPMVYMLPVPIGGISSGARVALRARGNSTSVGHALSLLYYESLSSDQVTTSEVLTSVPVGANGVTLTPSGTAWGNSSWVQLTAGLGTTAGLFGLAVRFPDTNVDCEFDLGTGASGSETVSTTLRWAARDVNNRMSYVLLPGIYYVAASTRIAVRLRKTGTSTTARLVSLLYYSGVSLPAGGPSRFSPFLVGS